MSFSTSTKSELARVVSTAACCRNAELAALVRLAGRLEIGADRRLLLCVATPGAAVARKTFTLFKECAGLSAEVSVNKGARLHKTNLYRVRLPLSRPTRLELAGLGLLDRSGRLARTGSSRFTGRDCCRRAYLRGAFLAAGSVSSPSGDYHLEIVTNAAKKAGEVAALMRRFGLKALIFPRKGRHVVYLKESESIAAFLKLAGAFVGFLEFENARVLRGVKGDVNRQVNCETANLNRTVEAGLRQLGSIGRLDEFLGLVRLPPALRAVAVLRVENPGASLQELGEMMEPKLSKSAVNHRLRRLTQLAGQLGKSPSGANGG
ncbi:MAG: DNA-binding protein WhiA [Peptococcaceae bacterium]|jgi:DNA-binding protein WhiA|nr:DNA-binding protein WhiA [Peptococcaceae bacterium]